jgi:cell division protein FtsZ
LNDAFRLADDVLHQGIQGISELITIPGLINLDFADVRAIMSEGGAALMAVGTGSGDEKAKKAAEAAISSQLLDITIDGARGVLFNVTGGPNMTLFEVNQAAAIIRETSHPDVNMIFGAVIDPNMGDDIRITVIATGFERSSMPRRALERNPRENKRSDTGVNYMRSSESVSVHTDYPASEPKSSSASTPSVSKDDLDIPTFLRNRR